MSAHSSSRRRSYGKRQKDLRDRRATDLSVDLDGPVQWPRGGAWAEPGVVAGPRRDHDTGRPGGHA